MLGTVELGHSPRTPDRLQGWHARGQTSDTSATPCLPSQGLRQVPACSRVSDSDLCPPCSTGTVFRARGEQNSAFITQFAPVWTSRCVRNTLTSSFLNSCCLHPGRSHVSPCCPVCSPPPPPHHPALEGLARVTATPLCSAAGIFPGFPCDATNTEQKKATTLFLTLWFGVPAALLCWLQCPDCAQHRQGYLKGCCREEAQVPVALVQELHLMRVRNVVLAHWHKHGHQRPMATAAGTRESSSLWQCVLWVKQPQHHLLLSPFPLCPTPCMPDSWLADHSCS